MKETHQLSENMKVFFEKLLELKSWVKQEIAEGDREASDVLNFVYLKLDEIIKEKK